MYKYIYKDKQYDSWSEVRKLFPLVSFPIEELLTTEILNQYGITRIEDLEDIKLEKLKELQEVRNIKENENIATSKGIFEFDSASIIRISNAMIAMNDTDTRKWTSADGIVIDMTKEDFHEIFIKASERSDNYFSKYNDLKALVEACTTKEEVEKISWDIINK